MTRERFLTVKQPWASLIRAGVKDVENRGKAVPSTLPQWGKCLECGSRALGWVGWNHVCPEGYQPGYGYMQPDGPFPFTLWIHAGAAYDTARFEESFGLFLTSESLRWSPAAFILGTSRKPDVAAGVGFPRGVLLGHVTVTGSHHADECDRWCSIPEADRAQAGITGPAHCSKWAQDDAYHWTLVDPVALPEPIPMKGMLGLPFLPDDVQAAALAQLEAVAA